MLKITNCKIVQGEKIYTMKESDNANMKISVSKGIVTIEEKDKNLQTLKAPTRTKKYLELIASFEAKKEEANKKKMEKEAKKIEVVQVEIIENVQEVQEVQANKIIEAVQEVQANNEVLTIAPKLNMQQTLQEKEKNYLIDVITNERENEYQNMDFRISLIDVMIDDTCKAHKVKNENGGERWTNFTMFIGSDNKVLDVQLMNAMQVVMEKYLQFLTQEKFEEGRKFFRGDMAKFNTYNGIILKNGNSISVPYWENNVVEYKEGNMECMKNILRIPYQNNVGEIRKYVHIAYYLAKKQVLSFYRGMKKIKLAQEHEAQKQSRKQA